jgi:hypothetical protein
MQVAPQALDNALESIESSSPTCESGKKSREVFVRLQCVIYKVDLPTQSFDAQGYLVSMWEDPEKTMVIDAHGSDQSDNACPFVEKYSPQELEDDGRNVPISKTNMWENARECTILNEWAGYHKSKPDVFLHQFRFKATFEERFEMQYFPYDRQLCRMVLNARSVNNKWRYMELRPAWLGENDGWGHKNVCMGCQLGPIAVEEYTPFDPEVRFPGFPDNKSGTEKPTFIVLIERKPYYYLTNVVVPTFVIGSCSLIALLPVMPDFDDRMQLTVTLLLTSVAFKLAIESFLPRVNYSTYLDYYLMRCNFSLIFLVILLNVIQACLLSDEEIDFGSFAIVGDTDGDNKQARLVDFASFIVLGILWLGLHICILLDTLLKMNLLVPRWPKVLQLNQDEHEHNDSGKTEYMYASGKKRLTW